MTSMLNQIQAILWKNLLINKRTKEFLRENISVIILGALIVVGERTTANNFITPFYLAIAIFGYSRATGLNWVNQKASRQKQLQKIMGMKSLSYAIGWIIYFLLNGLFICLIMMLIFRFGAVTDGFHLKQGYGFIHIVIIYILFMIAITGFILVLSNFFDNPKNAAQGIIFIQLLINFLYFFRLADTFRNSILLTRLSGIFPQMAFNFGLSSIGFGFENMDLNYSYEDGVISLLIEIFVFFILAFYLDQVLPNQFGTNKRPLFFLDCFKTRRQIPDQRLSLLQNDTNDANEHETSAIYEQLIKRISHPLIKMKNVIKKFDGKQVVSDVSMSYYPNQIFCLLGHNGAGKSTTINLLTGILKPQEGDISLLGMNFKTDMDQIRKNIGLCLQYNVLYDQMTVEQHLRFYCILKGIPKHQIKQQIQSIIEECNLSAEKQKLSKNLSGGNKRKLSLANSLIGKSKLIFLDEPSSGLDPNSRQSIWGILKGIRSPERCIILTTHHLEEAQQLSQRIGIMSYGKLVIVGNSDYIKETFNVGYHMILNDFFKQTIKQAEQIVENGIKGARKDEQTAMNTLKYILPLAQLSNFSSTFYKLQKICTISLKMSSLEDSFVKLGEDQMNQGVLQEIAEMELPKVQCRYHFSKQYKAIFLRKKLTSFRSLAGVVSIILPCLFITLGLALACLIIKGTDTQSQAAKYFILSYFLIWSFIFNTSSFCGDLVLERQKKFKYLSHVMGLKKLPYWTANYTFDYIMLIAPFSIFIGEVYAFGQSSEFIKNVIQYLIPVFLLFGLSLISYSYMFSFMFQKSSTAFRLFPFFNLIFFYSLPQISIVINPQSFLSKYIVPLVSPFMGLSNAFQTKQINKFIQTDYSVIYILICFVVQAIFFMTVTIMIESLRFRLKDRQTVAHFENQNSNENENQIEAQVSEDGQIVVRNLYKKYSNGYMAISNNSFSVNKGEIFGLLGPNGAGKSTTFNIITAALAKTSGSVKMFGFEVNRGIMEIFSNVGVCPQYDSLYQNMTTEEHLNYFAWLKGLSKQQIDQTLDYYYKILSLTNYVKIRSCNLSGGNKRKLVVSMAMLANPRIMFFDEPSSGVDPISRRYLWKSFSISARERDTAMILTTHTMNEAQSLCSKIGILIKGSFVAVSTLSGLKAKYGKGYRAIVKADPSKHSQIKQIVFNSFGKNNVNVQKIGDNQQNIVFTIASNNFAYSQAFKIFQQDLFAKGLIAYYKINQSTLQEIFLLLSELQPEPEQCNYKQPWEFCCWECGANGCQCLM